MSHETKPLIHKSSTGMWIDVSTPTYAPDGYIAGTWRKVRPGGRVKLGGMWWKHDKLKVHAGRWVWCQVNEYWHTKTEVYHNRPCMIKVSHFENHICDAL